MDNSIKISEKNLRKIKKEIKLKNNKNLLALNLQFLEGFCRAIHPTILPPENLPIEREGECFLDLDSWAIPKIHPEKSALN